ncbi:baseplate J/gp47 family protein [Dickeya poaceiphila]|uniref:Baseplate protein J-like barrel domain-containing protein n=1 Tax=Dickeya poaceiphila TaxID=568768 RepID=A0A5B8I4K4_9GAMM|nr:baseplate J/gp47 family protein [Dickeya poaceiphila]QDX29574.1 hypothetical protein Dpoa569_0001362 [Dickeya poaceiphila]
MATTTIETSVPSVSFSTSGLAVPDEADILSGRITDFSTALGSAMSQDLSTPQGQISVSDSAIIADKNDQLLAIVNQINPDYASGRFQDAIGRVYFMERIAATGTAVTATCSGLVGTIIPAGSLAQDVNGYIYASTSAATISSDGTVSVIFQNQTAGAIACPIGALTAIYQAVPGWSGVINNSAGVLGSLEESRANFEYRRKESVARNARNMDGAVLSAVLEVNGVLDAYVWSNRTASVVNKGTTNFHVLGHSIYICAYGGSDSDVANAIFKTYNPGADMNGNTTYTVYDSTNYGTPYPEYVMQWQKASPTRVYFTVNIDSTLNPPSNITQLVKNMVTTVFTGGYEGIGKARIGASINAGKYYAPVISISPDTVSVLSIEISLTGSSYAPSVTMGIDQIPTIQDSDITVNLV